jgi:hypothetical protein
MMTWQKCLSLVLVLVLFGICAWLLIDASSKTSRWKNVMELSRLPPEPRWSLELNSQIPGNDPRQFVIAGFLRTGERSRQDHEMRIFVSIISQGTNPGRSNDRVRVVDVPGRSAHQAFGFGAGYYLQPGLYAVRVTALDETGVQCASLSYFYEQLLD